MQKQFTGKEHFLLFPKPTELHYPRPPYPRFLPARAQLLSWICAHIPATCPDLVLAATAHSHYSFQCLCSSSPIIRASHPKSCSSPLLETLSLFLFLKSTEAQPSNAAVVSGSGRGDGLPESATTDFFMNCLTAFA